MNGLEAAYRERHDKVLVALAARLEAHITELFIGVDRIDRVTARAKSVSRFIAKSQNISDDGNAKYDEPLEQIQDQVGARVTVLFNQDVEIASDHAKKYFRYIESKEIEPAAVCEFSYFGTHFISFIPDDVLDPAWDKSDIPSFFELQIKTVFQHAWSEASHDIAYKPLLGELSREEKRALAFASAQAWGADKQFESLFESLTKRAAPRFDA